MALGNRVEGADGKRRCHWCSASSNYIAYHDDEWGIPVDDDRLLFEKVSLEGFQSGLSWLTILRKRENFRAAFANFDMQAVAAFGGTDVERLLADAGIVRHRGKIEAVVSNARKACEMVEREGSFAAFVWRYEPQQGVMTRPLAASSSPASVAMSKELKRRGWKFVGPTTLHAFMQAMGLVNDHAEGCWTRSQVDAARADFKRPV